MQTAVAMAITASGQRIPLSLEDAQRIATSSNEYALPPELDNVIILQSTNRGFSRIVVADVSLDTTPAGNHLVRTRKLL